MKLRFVIAWALLVAFIAAAARAEEKPADEKTKTEGNLLVAPADGANVTAGQVLATFDTAANNWRFALNDAGEINFVTVTHGNLLGVDVAPVDSPLRAHLDLKENQGVLITNVSNESDAAKAGLKQHDIIVRLNDDAIEGPSRFNELVSAQRGKEVKLQIVRQGKPTTLAITLPNTPVYQLANAYFTGFDANLTDNQYRIGVTLAQADDALRSQLRLATGEGALVADVVPDSPAAKAGMKQHDVLTQLDGKRVTTVEVCNAQIQEIKDRKVTATFIRGGKESSVELSPQLSATQSMNFTYIDVADRNLSNPQVHWYAASALTGGNNANASNTSASNAHQQIAALKQQLAAMQQSIAALEAALQTPPANKQPKDDKQQPQPESEKK